MGMIDDDLNAPLGQYPIQKHPLLGRASHTKIALGALCLLIGVGLLGGRGAFFPGPGGLPGLQTATGIPAAGTALRDTSQRDEIPASLPAEPPPSPPAAALAGEATAPLSTATLLDPALGHAEML